MKFIVSILMFLSVVLVYGQDNQTDAKGRKQGAWVKTYPKSKIIQYKGQFKDDKPIGTFSYYYESGKVKAIVKHDDNSTRSSAYFYHENGNLMSHGIYREMKKDSIWLNFTPAGRISSSETYQNDLLNGKKIVYYVPDNLEDKSRLPSKVSLYENGKLNGESVEYFQSGTVKSKGVYKNDKKIGVWDSFHPNGKKMMLERFKDGVHHGWHFAYDESGLETSRKYYYYGRLIRMVN
jgi:antitoxin component YwqK of YwqJK toxin-antitoxin module